MHRLFGTLFAAWSFGLGLVVGLGFGVLGVLPFWPIPRGRRERYTIHAASLWGWFVTRFVLLARVHVRGEVKLSDGRGAILLCNHRSWLDPLVLLGWTRSNGLSKQSILYIPFIGLFGWLAGAVYFDRRDKQARARARDEVIQLVRGGHRLQVFPEGTRSRDGALRSKVFLILVRDAFDAGLPVVPCAVMHTERTLPVRTVTAFPFQDVYLSIGEAMEPSEFESDEAFAIAAWGRVKALLEELQDAR